METTDVTLQTAVDKNEIPPLHQKRILAFVNHFIITTCTFLNEIALSCETRFIELERKLQKAEASLVILESKLASIPNDDVAADSTTQNNPTLEPEIVEDTITPTTNINNSQIPEQSPEAPCGVPAHKDTRYKKFFKMVQVGVPAQAVKIKMQSEGLQPDVLDTPDLILTDGTHSESDV